MKILLDMNLPRLVGRLLAAEGHTWRHVSDLGLYQAEDREILRLAKEEGEVVFTHDLDFGALLALSGDDRPSVVILRQRNLDPNHLYRSIRQSAEIWTPAVERGAIVILEDEAVRIRALPLGGR